MPKDLVGSVMAKALDTCCSAAYGSQESKTSALNSLRSFIRLMWANDTAMHYAAIQWLHSPH